MTDLVRGGCGSVNSEMIVVNGEEVRKALRKVNPNKAAGPDNVTPKVLKGCADQLHGILCYIFNLSLTQCVVSSSWKMPCIVPVRKRKVVTGMNDLRPVALTSCVMKAFDRVALLHLQVQAADLMDPFQFAYQRNRSVDDAIIHVLHNVCSHLGKKPDTRIRLMFYDFSSAFNIIQPNLLADKL